jgi:UDP-N-acetylmuramate: L-alanyl-gamma-D-glutamyl-meso-diaminopimelate ligase
MGSLALLARELGHDVSGCDANVYPPMSTQLEEQGIELLEGYKPEHLQPEPDIVIIGNAMSRGNPCVEYILDHNLLYTSGPQWLAEHVLQNRWVLAAAGTHGKTTTSSMLAWILEFAGLEPGYLIGGVPKNFSVSARLGKAADIFDDLKDIQKQFHHLVRTVPSLGRIISPANDTNIREVLEQGCWSETEFFSAEDKEADWAAKLKDAAGTQFEIFHRGISCGVLKWQCTGIHNVNNALASIAAALHAGVDTDTAINALTNFSGVKRRMEKLFDNNRIRVYDDFAHHPSAIRTTLDGLRKQVGREKIVAVIEPRSNTMRLGIHRTQLAPAAENADQVIWYQPENVEWNLDEVAAQSNNDASVCSSIDTIIDTLIAEHQDCHIVIMSNGSFDGLHQKLVTALSGNEQP